MANSSNTAFVPRGMKLIVRNNHVDNTTYQLGAGTRLAACKQVMAAFRRQFVIPLTSYNEGGAQGKRRYVAGRFASWRQVPKQSVTSIIIIYVYHSPASDVAAFKCEKKSDPQSKFASIHLFFQIEESKSWPENSAPLGTAKSKDI